MNTRIVLVGSAFAGWTLLTLLDAAAKVGILLGLAALVVFCMRRSSAASRHLVWLCALTGALLLPFSSKFLPQWQVLPSWMRWEEVPELLLAKKAEPMPAFEMDEEFGGGIPIDASEHDLTDIPQAAPKTTTVSIPERIFRLPAKWFIGAWFAGILALMLPLLSSSLALRRRRALGRRVRSGPLFATLGLLKNELGMRRAVELLIGGPSDMPMVWGIFRYRLLLPDGAENWPENRIRPVLLHELSHLRRNDPLALLVGHLALALHWFNPFAWLAIRQMRIEQENACDDSVLRHGVLSSDYAGQVLEVCSSYQAKGPFMALTMARSSGIEGRIAGILDASRNRRSTTRRLVTGFATITALAAFPLAILRAGDVKPTLRGKILDRNGVALAESPSELIREYPFGTSSAHRLGYTQRTGRSGLEKEYESVLAQGEDVKITLDRRIQQALEDAMGEGGVVKGAAVILDCKNGDLLADASYPSFNPNDFHPTIDHEKWKILQKNKDAPFQDRTTFESSPASIYKLVNALAGCRAGEGAMMAECEGAVHFGNIKFNCWIHNLNGGKHGLLDLRRGISQSCNCYAAALAARSGIEQLDFTAGILGLKTVSEQYGELGQITPHMIAMASIGQGPVKASPLQLAVVAAAIGNGGKVWVPRLTLDEPPRFRADLLEKGWKAADLAIIRSGMWDCVNTAGGTGRRARSEVLEIAGKTGTAQVAVRGEKSTNAWFVGYAPAESPKYALTIMVEGGNSGGAICGPIARRIFETICLEN